MYRLSKLHHKNGHAFVISDQSHRCLFCKSSATTLVCLFSENQFWFHVDLSLNVYINLFVLQLRFFFLVLSINTIMHTSRDVYLPTHCISMCKRVCVHVCRKNRGGVHETYSHNLRHNNIHEQPR